MNAPEAIVSRAEANLLALFEAYDVQSVERLSMAIFLEFEAGPVLEVVRHDGCLVTTLDLRVVDSGDVASLVVLHEGRLPHRLDLTAYASPAEARAAFDRMAEGCMGVEA